MIESAIALIFLLTGAGISYRLMMGEVKRLREDNRDLTGSLFQRIGYRREKDPPREPAREVKDEGVPDVLERQAKALSEP